MPSYMSLISITIGMLVGSVGVGGFLMLTALMLLMDVGIHQDMATSLFAFIFMGVAGTIYFHNKGNIDWRLVTPICFGAVFTGYAGAWIGSLLSPSILTLLMAVIIFATGSYTLCSAENGDPHGNAGGARRQWIILAAIGAVTGFLSGLTGIGGPALSVPLMLLFGFPVLTSIGVGQVLQIVGALSGTVANMKFGSIDFGLASYIAVFEVGGVLAGAYLVHRLDSGSIKKFVGALCILTGSAFILRVI